MLDRHPMRPGHIHLLVTHPKYAPLTTQIFDRESPHIEDDSVFAVKTSLIVDFEPLKNVSENAKEANAKLQLEYDVLLAPLGDMKSGAKATNGHAIGDNAQSM